MAYWHMTNKVARHPDIDSGETVLHACYGLSAAVTGAANVASRPLSSRGPDPFRDGLWDTGFGGDGGLAEPLQKNGVLALTDRRLIYFRKRFAIGKPKKILCAWPLDQVAGVEHAEEDRVLRIRFVDGSTGGLHVPSAQKPDRFLNAYEGLA